MKLNFGSGLDYREGWTNIDFNCGVKADAYFDFAKFPWPLKDNTYDYVYASHVIEHFSKQDFFKVMEELHRICKPGAILEIYTPHFTSILNLKVPYHYGAAFGIGTFRIFEEAETGMGERYSPARFKVLKEELHFVLRDYENYKFLKPLGWFNFLFNLGGWRFWQMLMERLFFPGFDEIKFVLKTIK